MVSVDEPWIIPPFEAQEYKLPKPDAVEKIFCLYAHTLSGPLITGTGVGLILIVFNTIESQPKELVFVRVTEPLPDAPQNTLMIVSVDEPWMNPPLAVQE